jgi:hypothetical protein
MKFNARESKEKSNFKSSKVIKAKIGNTAKMLKMFTKDLYKHPLQTSIQEYINNAKDAHTMVGKDMSTIEITAPTVANQNVIIRDYGPGLSPDDIVDIFANIAVSNKDDSDLFNGGFGIGSKSWFAVNTAFIVISVYEKQKTYYSVKFDEKQGIFIEVDFEEETEDANGVEVQLPLANSNQIEDANIAIFRAVEFWETKPVLINCQKEFYETVEENEDYTLISYNQSGQGNSITVTLGRTPYSIRELPCFHSIQSQLRYYNIAIHFKVGEMNLENVQEVGPDRESYALVCSDIIENKVNKIHAKLIGKIEKKLKDALDIEEINTLISHPELSNKYVRRNRTNDNALTKELFKGCTLKINSNRSSKLSLDYLPMTLADNRPDYINIEGVASQADSYLGNCIRVPYILLLDDEKAKKTDLKRAVLNFTESSAKPSRHGKTYSGVYILEAVNYSKKQIEILSKYFTVKKYSEVKVVKVKIAKDKIEKNKNEVNLMKVNWKKVYCSNVKVMLKDLSNKDYTYLTKKDYDELSIEWDSLYKYNSQLEIKVFMVATSSESLFKNLKYKKFNLENANKMLEEKRAKDKEELKQKALDSGLVEEYTKTDLIEYVNNRIISGRYGRSCNNVFKNLDIENEVIKEMLSLDVSRRRYKLQSEIRPFNSVWKDIEKPQDVTLLNKIKDLERKFPLAMKALFNFNSDRLNEKKEIEFLFNNLVK